MGRFKLIVVCAAMLLFAAPSALADDSGPPVKTVAIGHGLTLHYVEAGSGPSLVLIHGSLSDYSYWRDQFLPLAQRYHVVDYSRRYNWPNTNKPIAGYSAITDADDLAALIAALHLGKVYVIGHSYGALTALFAASRHPGLFKAIVLAEPPAISLLKTLAPKLYADVQTRMVAPMKTEFSQGETEKGVATFINYVFADPDGWQKMNDAAHADTLKDAEEWNVMLPHGTLFPAISPSQVRAIAVPMLVMSGGKTYWFLQPINAALPRLLPHSEAVTFADAGHQMWLKHPDEARADAEDFFDAHR